MTRAESFMLSHTATRGCRQVPMPEAERAYFEQGSVLPSYTAVQAGTYVFVRLQHESIPGPGMDLRVPEAEIDEGLSKQLPCNLCATVSWQSDLRMPEGPPAHDPGWPADQHP